jgi:2,4-dienoyl-CoA reductase-like NADH-dependent reductase (Old Yellow Enzyme family)
MSRLFSSLKLRDLTFRNRIFVSPMCQYSSRDGLPTDSGTWSIWEAALWAVRAWSW